MKCPSPPAACDTFACSACGYATTTLQACPCLDTDLPTCPGCGTEMALVGGPGVEQGKRAINWLAVLQVVLQLLALFGIVVPAPPVTPKTSK